MPFYSGPILLDHELTGAASLAAGGVDHLRARVSLPASAGDAMQGKRSSFSFVFTACSARARSAEVAANGYLWRPGAPGTG